MQRLAALILGLAVMLSGAMAYAGDVSYTTHVRDIIAAKCLACHGADAPDYDQFKKEKDRFIGMHKGPKMSDYANLIFFTGWPDTGAFMRRLDNGENTKDGKPGNMYAYLGDTDAERSANLTVIKAWVGNWTMKKFPDLTKEDLAGIKVKY